MDIKIKKIRLKLGITQSELAKKAKISVSYIQKIEYGERKTPSIKIAFKIAAALNTTVEELFL